MPKLPMGSSKYYMAPYPILCVLLLLLPFTTIVHAQSGLSSNFYYTSCPNFETIVESNVSNVVSSDPRMGASLLRLHFHDCFVGGCDASVLLDVEGGEKESVHNVNSLRGFGVIDSIKQEVEDACPGVVSCADIVALVARDSVVALGGPSWDVEFGRRDSNTRPSSSEADENLPFGFNDVPDLISLFSSKGFSVRELVALSGSHTIGQARCVRFRNRAYNEENIAPDFQEFLQEICPRNSGDNNLGPLDVRSPTAFNNEYYVGLTNFEGLLHSDQVLFTGNNPSQTDNIVRRYANNERIFFKDFSAAMLKMSRLGVLTGDSGTIRSNCRVLG
ncbi:Cationic peroxidase 1 [Bienertia sinuspersici]